MKYKTQDRLAKSIFCLLRGFLESNGIDWTEGIQHGGGTINHEQLCIGDLELAVNVNGKIEVVDIQMDHSQLFDLSKDGELPELLVVASRGNLNQLPLKD